jgi:hypothetical protein
MDSRFYILRCHGTEFNIWISGNTFVEDE